MENIEPRKPNIVDDSNAWDRFFRIMFVVLFVSIVACLCFVPKKANAGLFMNIFRTVEYNGHSYILHTNSEHFLHDPDCECRKVE